MNRMRKNTEKNDVTELYFLLTGTFYVTDYRVWNVAASKNGHICVADTIVNNGLVWNSKFWVKITQNVSIYHLISFHLPFPLSVLLLQNKLNSNK